jgi:hypothetical protein
MATQQPAQSGYNPQQFNDALRDYLRKLYASQGRDPREADADLDSANSGGGGGAGGAAGGVGALLATLAVKWGAQKVLGPIIKQQVTGPVKDYILQQLGMKTAETGAQAGATAATEAGASAATEAGASAATEALSTGATAASEAGATGAAQAAMAGGEAALIGGGGALPAGSAAIGAGAYSIPAGAAVPAGYTAVGTAANGGTVVASNTSILGGASATGTGTGTSTAATAGSGSYAAAAGIVAGVVAAYMAYRDRKKIQKQAGGGNLTEEEIKNSGPMSSIVFNKLGPFSKAANHNWNYGPLSGVRLLEQQIWGSTKSDGQVLRDRVRKAMKNYGIVDDKFQLGFNDGSSFDMGKDGRARLQNADGSQRQYGDVDLNDQFQRDTITGTNPLGYLLAARYGKKNTPTEIVGYLNNAVTQGTTDRNIADTRIKELYSKAGFKTAEDAYAGIDGLKESGAFDDQTAQIFRASIAKYLPTAQSLQQPAKPIPRTGRGPSNVKK